MRQYGWLAIAAVLVVPLAVYAIAPPPEQGSGLVASDHVLVSRAGAEVLESGGNAVDAAVAAALAAGVVQPAGSGLGGGGFALIVDGDTREILDFREVAPAAATPDMYRTPDGGVHPDASRVGGLAVGVPGEPRGLARLLETHGTLSPSEVAAPAIRYANRGFPIGNHLARALERTRYAGVTALFGGVPRPGTVTRRPDLARTLKKWVSSRGESLYEGSAAEEVAAAVAEAGGVLTTGDLAAYAPVTRTPIAVTYRGYTVLTMPPPSSGGVALGQMLQALEAWDLQSLGHNSAAYVHLVTEVMKHAFADRARFLGDADHVDVPVERLLSEARIDEIRRKVWPSRTFGPEWYGSPVAPPEDAGTQHISVIDAAGRAAALTTTINTSFGSGVVVEGLGIVLNNEMDDFAAAPGVPNAYGLVGAEANAVAPGKRPLSSMSPTVVLDGDGEVVMVVGGSGGSFIISGVLQAILNVVEFDMNPQEAVTAPRFHHQWAPDKLFLEPFFAPEVTAALESRGHTLAEIDRFAAIQMVLVGDEALIGGSDPSKGGWPAGHWAD